MPSQNFKIFIHMDNLIFNPMISWKSYIFITTMIIKIKISSLEIYQFFIMYLTTVIKNDHKIKHLNINFHIFNFSINFIPKLIFKLMINLKSDILSFTLLIAII